MIDLSLVFSIAVLIEMITLFGRFLFKLSSKSIYVSLIKKLGLKFFIHFHHSFFGLIISILSLIFNFPLALNLGIGMIISDLFHHFVVLWSVVGNPEFHIIYKNPKYFEMEQEKEKRKINKFIKHLIHVFD